MTRYRTNPVRAAAPLALALALGVAGGAARAQAPAPPSGAATAPAVTSADLRARVGVLAHDSLRGRGTGSPGALSAARYLAGEAERLGLRPAGDDGGYLQRVPLTRRRTAVEAGVRTPEGERALTRDDVALVSGLGGLPGSPRPEGQGELIYAGYMVDPTVPREAELRPAQVAGAALIVRLEAAPGVDTTTAGPRIPLGALLGPGSPASAILLVAQGGGLEPFWDYARHADGFLSLAGGEGTGGAGGGPPIFLVSPEAAERLIGAPLAEARMPKAGLGTFRFRVADETAPVEAWNVVAALPGADPARAGQYVALGAHYDHEGVGEPVAGDSIYNGADDNASGSSALLEVAERFASLPAAERPARSLLFTWFTAEEDGLLGSEHFTDHPTVPRDSIVAHLNLDMLGRNHPDSLFVVGSRRLSTALGETVEAANARLPRPLVLDYSLDTPGHPEQIYCRSDHASFARYGIPVAFFTTGLHEDYHEPSDEPETLDYEKLARVTGLVEGVAGALAAAAGRPAVDGPVPPPGAPCAQ